MRETGWRIWGDFHLLASSSWLRAATWFPARHSARGGLVLNEGRRGIRHLLLSGAIDFGYRVTGTLRGKGLKGGQVLGNADWLVTQKSAPLFWALAAGDRAAPPRIRRRTPTA